MDGRGQFLLENTLDLSMEFLFDLHVRLDIDVIESDGRTMDDGEALFSLEEGVQLKEMMVVVERVQSLSRERKFRRRKFFSTLVNFEDATCVDFDDQFVEILGEREDFDEVTLQFIEIQRGNDFIGEDVLLRLRWTCSVGLASLRSRAVGR